MHKMIIYTYVFPLIFILVFMERTKGLMAMWSHMVPMISSQDKRGPDR